MQQRDFIDSAVAKLGPERAKGALRAFDPGNDSDGWTACALALAYGERGELLIASCRSYPDFRTPERVLEEELGLSYDECEAVEDAFDAWEDAERPADLENGEYLRAALQAEAAKLEPQPEPPAWEDAPQHDEGELVYVTA